MAKEPHDAPAVDLEQPWAQPSGGGPTTPKTTGELSRAGDAPSPVDYSRATRAGGADAGTAMDLHLDLTHQVAAAGVSGPGQAVPYADAIQRSLGDRFDVGQVTAHVGGEAEAAAQQIGAVAYATGNHIALPRDASLHTVAHEVAHVAQQEDGVHLAGGVGAAGDRYERHADAIADRVVAGQLATDLLGDARPATRSAAVQRKAKGPTPDASPVGGDGAKAPVLVDGMGELNVAGQFGHSQIIGSQGAAEAAAAEQIGNYAGAHLKTVAPDFSKLRPQLDRRATEAVDLDRQRSSLWSDDVSHQQRLVLGRDWCKGKVVEWQQYQTDAQQMLNDFNGWVPFANGMFLSLARLEGMQQLLGVSDPAAMVAALLSGLDAADSVAGTLIATTGQHNARMPRSDTSVAAAGNDCLLAFRTMNTEYLGYQSVLLGWLRAGIDAKGDGARARLAEIEKIKATVKKIGGAVDLTMGKLKSAPGRVSAASKGVERAIAQQNAQANKKARLAGGKEDLDPSYTVTGADGQLVSRDLATGLDTALVPGVDGEMKVSPSPADGPGLPVSLGGALDFTVNLVFAGEIAALKRQLEIIGTQVDAIDRSEKAIAIQHKIQAFVRSIEAFDAAAQKMKKTIEQRRRDYLDFGMQLDEFAAGTPKPKQERFATIMMMVSQIREVLAVGRGATKAVGRDEARWAAFITSAQQSRGARPENGHGYSAKEISAMSMPAEESGPMWIAAGSIQTFKGNVAGLEKVLGPVDQRSQAMMMRIGADQGGAKDDPSNY